LEEVQGLRSPCARSSLPWRASRRAGTQAQGARRVVRRRARRLAAPQPAHQARAAAPAGERETAERQISLSDEQVKLLERFSPEFRERHIEAEHTGSLVAVDTFFVGTLKGIGKIYMQSAIDCHSRHAWARLYPSKLPVTADHILNNDVIPTFEAHDARIETVLSDNGREFCGRPDQHPYELFLQLEEIEHRTTKVRRPQSNGIVERFHRTVLDEHFRVEGRRTWFETIEEMQAVLDDWLVIYNTRRPHQGRNMGGRTPLQAFTDGLIKRARTATAKNKRRDADNSAETGFNTTRNPRRLNLLQRAALSGEYRFCTIIERYPNLSQPDPVRYFGGTPLA
jgi:transposase InsO family protein